MHKPVDASIEINPIDKKHGRIDVAIIPGELYSVIVLPRKVWVGVERILAAYKNEFDMPVGTQCFDGVKILIDSEPRIDTAEPQDDKISALDAKLKVRVIG
jgi:hypothetical protein